MQPLATVGDFQSKFPALKRWNRAADALRSLEHMPPNQMRSIGDSLTYVRTTPATLDTDLVGHRRYFSIIRAVDTPVTIVTAPKALLVPSRPYSDLSDREYFRTNPDVISTVTLAPGEVLIIEIDQAYRVTGNCEYGLVRLTVEAVSFHNK